MKLIGQILFPILLIALGYVGFEKLKSLKPEAKSKEAKVVIPVVSVSEVSPEDHTPPILSFGTVQSYFETTLTPQVTGEIVEVSDQFRAGVMVKKGDVLARIDVTDYKALLANFTAAKINARQVLAEEEINVRQASEDWIASGRSLADASDFVLRKPQLAAAQANIDSAEAAEAKAKVDIERTVIRAPYDAMVVVRSASLGNLATPQQSLGRLVATSKAEIRLPLTAEQINRLDVSRLSAGDSELDSIDVSLESPNHEGCQWQAKLVRMEAVVDQENQVTYVIAEVDKPYTRQGQPLIVGTFVNAQIPGAPISNSYLVQESSLVNDESVWVVHSEGILKKLSAKRVQSYEGNVFLQIETEELEPSLNIVTRPLTNFKNGDKVKHNINAE